MLSTCPRNTNHMKTHTPFHPYTCMSRYYFNYLFFSRKNIVSICRNTTQAMIPSRIPMICHVELRQGLKNGQCAQSAHNKDSLSTMHAGETRHTTDRDTLTVEKYKTPQEKPHHVFCEGCIEKYCIVNVWIFKYMDSCFCANDEQTADSKKRRGLQWRK